MNGYKMGDDSIKVVAPYAIVKLVNLRITSQLNRHILLSFDAVIEADSALLSEKGDISVLFTQMDKEEILFSGKQTHIHMEHRGGVWTASVEAASHTQDLDFAKRKRSFQQESMTYGDFIGNLLEPYGDVQYMDSLSGNQPLASWKLQYEETDWEFLNRMGAMMGGVVVADGRQSKPSFYFGLPEGSQYQYTLPNYTIRKVLPAFRSQQEEKPESSFFQFQLESPEFMYLGDQLHIHNMDTRIIQSVWELKNGGLSKSYVAMPEAGILSTFAKKRTSRSLSLAGSVLDRKQNKIQVKLDIDEENPACGACWFPYESSYALGSSHGIYTMPETGQRVAVTIPEGDEKKAYAFFSLRMDGENNEKTQDPSVKRFENQNHQELQASENHLQMIAGNEKNRTFVSLDSEKGIQISSNQGIVIKGKNISLFSENLKLKAAKEVKIDAAGGSIVLDGDAALQSPIIDIKAQSEKGPSAPKGGESGSVSQKKAVQPDPENVGTDNIDNGHTCAAGDPVDVATGNYYIHAVDMTVKGAEGFGFERFHNSLIQIPGSMGRSFRHNYEIRADISDEKITIIWADGRREYFEKIFPDTYLSKRSRLKLQKMDNGYLLENYNSKTYRFNAYGRLIQISGKVIGEIQLTYENGLLTQIGNRCGNLFLTYNQGRLTRVSDVSGQNVQYIYQSDQITQVKGINQAITRYEYDEEGRITAVYNPSGICEAKNTYDHSGRLIEQVIQESGRIYLEYDDENRITTLTERDDTKILYKRDEKNRIVEKVFIDGVEKTSFDQGGSIQSFTDKNGNTYAFSYGSMTKITNPLGEISLYRYDAMGNVIEEENAAGHKCTYQYDQKGNVIAYTGWDGAVTHFHYDAAGHLAEIEMPNGASQKFQYDDRGNILSFTDGEGCVERFQYDILNRLEGFYRPLGNETRYTYNALDAIATRKDADGYGIQNTYDAQGRLVSHTNRSGKTTRYEYGKNGKIAKCIEPEGRITAYDYNDRDMLCRILFPDGGSKRFQYNEAQFLAVEIDEEGQTQRYFYDANGNMVKKVDQRENVEKYTYDGLNRLTSHTNANGATTKYFYRYDGKLEKVIDSEGGMTQYGYDNAGRLIQVIDALNQETQYEYDAIGECIKKIDPMGKEINYTRDKNGRLTAITYSDGTQETLLYDQNGNVLTFTDKGGGVTRYRYDSMDRVIGSVNPMGGEKRYDYTPAGKLRSVTDENGAATYYDYDVFDNLVRATDSCGFVTRYSYDSMNRLTQISQPADGTADVEELITLYRYNKKGQVVAEEKPDRQVICYEYDQGGNLVRRIERDGTEVQIAYDALNQIQQIQYSPEKTASFQYDSLGRIIAMLDWLGETTFTYDLLGRIQKVTDCNRQTVSYTWNALNQKESITYPDGAMIAYTYGDNGMLAQAAFDGRSIQYTYSPTGMAASMRLPNEQWIAYAYDPLGRMTSMVQYDSHQQEIESRKYTYDMVGNKISAQGKYRAFGTGQAELWNVSYQYDAKGQLTGIHNIHGGQEQFAYDSRGNRIQRMQTHNGAQIREQYLYDPCNRLIAIEGQGEATEFTYDDRGNLTGMKGPDAVMEYTYDETNRLVQAAGRGVNAQFTYNGFLHRMAREINGSREDYVNDITAAYHDILAIRQPEGVKNRYYGNNLFGSGQKGKYLYCIADEMGSLLRCMDDQGNVAAVCQYDAFGNSQKWGDIHPFTSFTGYEEEEFGLQYVQARYYMPQIGRFVEEDTNKGKLYQPGTLNYYVHCLNNPVIRIDRDGQDSWVFYDPNLHKKGGGQNNAKLQAKALKEYFKYDSDEKVHLVPTSTADDFIEQWNNMGQNGESIEAVVLIGHGNKSAHKLETSYNGDVEETTLDMRKFLSKKVWASDKLEKKDVGVVVTMGCQQGKSDADGSNYASAIAKKDGIKNVIASDSYVITFNKGTLPTLISSGYEQDSVTNTVRVPDKLTGDGFKLYPKGEKAQSIGNKFPNLKEMLKEAQGKGNIAISQEDSYVDGEGVRLRSLPGTQAASVRTLLDGEKFTLAGRAQDQDGRIWCKVIMEDGQEGYILKKYCVLSQKDVTIWNNAQKKLKNTDINTKFKN